MDEYIKRDNILDCLAKDCIERTDSEEALICNIWDKIKKIPAADVVEVVRCKDCINYNRYYGECTLHGAHFGENGYCCSGRKMDGKGEGE